MPTTSSAPSNRHHQALGASRDQRHRQAPFQKPLSFKQQHHQPSANKSFRAMDDEERQPLIPGPGSYAATADGGGDAVDHHDQFCNLVGVRPLNHPHEESHRPHPQSLYVRAVARRQGQSCTYMFTATLVNTLLLSQVILGASLTGLAASDSNRILITVFGALNTVIAGVVAFLKSRGQPMRARMFRDDLSRVVDEIENSAVMWYGISQGAHGYGAIDTDDQVTVRGEVARLTRLYDKAVKNNTMNDPDMYNANGAGDSFSAGLRKAGGAPAAPGPAISAAAAPPDFAAGAAPAPGPAADPDDSPASKAPEPSKAKSDTNSDKGADGPKRADTAPAAVPVPQESEPTAQAKSADGAPAGDASAPAPTPVAETPKAAADDKAANKDKAVSEAATPRPTPAKSLPSHISQDPDESPASAVSFPKRESSTKTLVDTK